jgi:hypothetical protein
MEPPKDYLFSRKISFPGGGRFAPLSAQRCRSIYPFHVSRTGCYIGSESPEADIRRLVRPALASGTAASIPYETCDFTRCIHRRVAKPEAQLRGWPFMAKSADSAIGKSIGKSVGKSIGKSVGKSVALVPLRYARHRSQIAPRAAIINANREKQLIADQC